MSASSILVVSSERYSGKSSLSVGLALELRDRGLEVGYMKPVGAYPMKVEGRKVDEDSFFIAEALGLPDKLTDITPCFLNWDTLTRYMRKKPGNLQTRVKKAFERISEGRDVVLIEGAQDFVHGKMLGLSAKDLCGLLDSRLLLLDTFNDELSVDRILSARDFFAGCFLGAVLNWVPQRRMEFTRNLLKRFLEDSGVRLYGSLPTDRVLRSITVKDLALGLNGTIVSAQDRGEELIESMMVGAMGQQQALRLFRKQANKVVITGGDRSDIQLAALDTPTKSLVLTGGHRPSPQVLGQAEEMGVPIILVDYDTATAVERVESAIGHQKVHSPGKIDKIREYIRSGIDLDALLEDIGVS